MKKLCHSSRLRETELFGNMELTVWLIYRSDLYSCSVFLFYLALNWPIKAVNFTVTHLTWFSGSELVAHIKPKTKTSRPCSPPGPGMKIAGLYNLCRIFDEGITSCRCTSPDASPKLGFIEAKYRKHEQLNQSKPPARFSQIKKRKLIQHSAM